MRNDTSRRKQYYVWHIPQVPGKPFVVDTDSLAEAKMLVDVLANYDLFQYENRIKPDYSNANGVMEWDADLGEYCDLEEDDEYADVSA